MMKKQFTQIERDAFAKAVSAVESISFTKDDDVFFQSLFDLNSEPKVVIARVLERALAKV